jgi:hypothetical protein
MARSHERRRCNNEKQVIWWHLILIGGSTEMKQSHERSDSVDVLGFLHCLATVKKRLLPQKNSNFNRNPMLSAIAISVELQNLASRCVHTHVAF